MLRHFVTEDQSLMLESARRLLRDRYSFAHRANIIATDPGYDAVLWRLFAEQGWLGLNVPVELGGLGGSMLDLLVLMSAFGEALVVEPYLPSIVLGALSIASHGTEAQRARLLPGLLGGAAQIALAFAEPDGGYDAHHVETTSRRSADGFLLSGHKSVVLGAPYADHLIVSARSFGAVSDAQGISLFVIERDRPGVRLRPYATIDGRRAAEVLLENVPVAHADLLGSEGAGGPIIDAAIARGIVAELGCAVGALQGALDLTISYLNMREQFGRKLATYQALRHKVADMFVQRQECAALAVRAARACDDGDAGESTEALAAAKAYFGEEGRKLCENAVQMHGAIAITEEYICGHYLKRLVAADRMFGGVDHHLDVYMRTASMLVGEPAQ